MKVKQLLIDCHENGEPWALRVVYFIEIPDPEGGEPTPARRVREVPCNELSLSVRENASGLLRNAPDIIAASRAMEARLAEAEQLRRAPQEQEE